MFWFDQWAIFTRYPPRIIIDPFCQLWCDDCRPLFATISRSWISVRRALLSIRLYAMFMVPLYINLLAKMNHLKSWKLFAYDAEKYRVFDQLLLSIPIHYQSWLWMHNIPIFTDHKDLICICRLCGHHVDRWRQLPIVSLTAQLRKDSRTWNFH